MVRQYPFFYAALGFWLLALAAWIFHHIPGTLAAGSLALGAFLLHGLQQRIFTMFRKEKTQERVSESVEAVVKPAEKVAQPDIKPDNTVIAGGVRFDGNLIAGGQVYIYGEVFGNIEAKSGLVKIMRNGRVEGNILCHELIIDGAVIGECEAESMTIDENGNVDGAIIYGALSVKKGGTFIGRAEFSGKAAPRANVIEMLSEPASSQSQG